VKKSKIYQVRKLVNEELDKPQTIMRYKVDSYLVTGIKIIQAITGGLYDNTEKKYIDCALEVQDIPDWLCQ